jgi:hypothetical protein
VYAVTHGENEPATHKSEHALAIANNYATGDDFRKSFTEELVQLYLLSYLLTGSRERAEQCLVAGLEDCVNNNAVFRE